MDARVTKAITADRIRSLLLGLGIFSVPVVKTLTHKAPTNFESQYSSISSLNTPARPPNDLDVDTRSFFARRNGVPGTRCQPKIGDHLTSVPALRRDCEALLLINMMLHISSRRPTLKHLSEVLPTRLTAVLHRSGMISDRPRLNKAAGQSEIGDSTLRRNFAQHPADLQTTSKAAVMLSGECPTKESSIGSGSSTAISPRRLYRRGMARDTKTGLRG